MLNIYRLTSAWNGAEGHYSAIIVCAENEHEALHTPPSEGAFYSESNHQWEGAPHCWAALGDIRVELIGVAVAGVAKGLILASTETQ